MSLKYSKLLNSYVDWTDEEIAAGKKYLKWEEINLNWESIDMVWEDISILLEVEQVIKRGGGYGYKEYVDGNPWKQLKQELGEEKTKKVIKLYCKVNGVEHLEYGYINEDIKVTAYDFELFVKDSVAKNISVKINK